MIEPLPDLASVYFLDIETTGLDPHRDKVVTAQVRHGGQTLLWKEWELGEAGCLKALLSLLGQVQRRRGSVVGYNVLRFDIPFLDVRLRGLGLMDEGTWHLLYGLHVIDLYQLLGDYYARASQWYLSVTTVENETFNAEIPMLYEAGAYSFVEEYVEKEMEAMEFLYEDTEGEELPAYKPRNPPPLLEVAERFGMRVNARHESSRC